MRMLRPPRLTAALLAVAVLAGSAVAGLATIALATGATAASSSTAGAVFDVIHLPPVLTLPNERSELLYETHCAAAGEEDPEAACRAEGTLFARASSNGPFLEVPLAPLDAAGRRLVARLPASLRDADLVEYYAELSSPDAGMRLTLPPGGASAPAASQLLADAVDVVLARPAFGRAPLRGQRVAFARWGNGPHDAGLEQGRAHTPIGASAFDVDAAGSVILLDHAHRRVLRWARGADTPERIPLSINGTIADVASASDGSLYVLETTSRDGRAPLIRRFDDAGRELEAVETAERGPAQIRMGARGPIVLQRPSHQWMPAAIGGVPAAPASQRRAARMGRSLPSGGEVLVLRTGNELRVGVLANGTITRSWRIRSDVPLAEVQLAEPLGPHFLVVVRLYVDDADEFAALVLERRGVRARMTLASAEWAEGAPLGRFRLAGRSLYRLGSSPAGVFVDRFDLEVR